MTPWIPLLRPGNAVIAAAAVWVGWAGLRLQPEWQLAFWGSLSMFLMVAAGNAHNDTLDLETDRVNRPLRPLAAGLIRVGSARAAAALLLALAVVAAWIGSPLHGALALVMAVLLWAYNRFLKGTPLAGNFVVSLLCGLAVYFVELPLLVDFPELAYDSLPAALFAFLATFAREVAKDAEDVAGDRAAGLRTFAVTAGTDAARRLVFSLVVLLLLFLPVPLLFFDYHARYALVLLVAATPVIILLLRALARDGGDFTAAQKLLKLLMLAGMAAILAGTVGRGG